MISVIMAPRFEEMPVTKFQESNWLTGQLSTSYTSPSASRRFAFMVQILSSSQISKKSQCIKRSPTNFALPTSLPQAKERRHLWWLKIGSHLDDDACPSNRAPSSRLPHHSICPSASVTPPEVHPKINHPRRFRHSDIPDLPPFWKLRSPSIRVLATDHP